MAWQAACPPGGSCRRAHLFHPQGTRLEHDAEKCEGVSDDIMLYLFDLEPDSDFRSIRPEIIRL
ncbi:hypothetical protein EOA33_16875 [Mesorhizobium sp. M4A.F.Ca.ET.050.02.1.1]|nr:hypothetical protein EOA33_16875 [Mesorhizobium sp. M4A.F.Ca.ET.050.02.1.1]